MVVGVWTVILRSMSSFEEIPDRLDGVATSRRALALWYLIAFVTYVAAATLEKGLLNWIVGPAWLVAVITFGPRLRLFRGDR